MNTLHGKLRPRGKRGYYTYRLIVSNGVRKDFPLKTTDIEEAIQLATELDKAYLADTHEELVAQMSAIRGFSKRAENISFEEAWDKYQVHPERATPHTVSEQRAYRITFDEFVRFATEEYSTNRTAKRPVTCISEVTPHLSEAFAAYLKTTMLAVDTHNRKIKRLRKIFVHANSITSKSSLSFFKHETIKFLLPVWLSARQTSWDYARPHTDRKRAGHKTFSMWTRRKRRGIDPTG